MKKFNCPHCKKEIDPKEIDIFQNYEEELKIEIKQKAEQENKHKLNAFLVADRKKNDEVWTLKEEKKDTKHRVEIESFRKTVVQLQKKTNQGLTVNQGSAQEIVLGKYLEELNPYDKFTPFAKGKPGADWLQDVKNPKGEVVGKILYESKDEKSFSNKWEPKLQNDMKDSNADVGVIFTIATPRNFNKKQGFQNNSNIYICECDYSSLRTLVFGLRLNLILKDSLKVRGKDNFLSAPELLENPKVLNYLASMRQKHKKRLKDAKHLVTTVTKAFKYEKESGDEYDEFIQLLEELVSLKFPFDDDKNE